MAFEATGVEHVGAVGHYASALLQTAGLFGQESVLEFMGPIIEQVGMLVYIVAIISALISFALFGGYRQAAYLLLGPALFFFVLHTRVPVSGTMVRLGATPQKEKGTNDVGSIMDQRAALNRLSSALWGGEHPKVSWFFVLYDDLISQVIQNIAALLLDDSKREDLIATGKERVYSQINLFKSHNGGFIHLLSKGMTGHCSRVRKMSKDLAQAKYEAGHPMYAELNKLRTKKTINLMASKEIQEYLILMFPVGGGEAYEFDESSFKTLKSCQEIWEWTVASARLEAKALEMRIVADERTDINPGSVANPNIDQSNNSAVIPWREVWDEVQAQAAEGSAEQMITLLSAVLIKNTMKYTEHSAVISTMTKHSDFNQARFTGKFQFLANAEAQAWYMKIVYFSGALPYLQGLFLYLLCMLFPFFAIFLIMPGRVSSFAVWMSLWLWVKSWDVGFAFVYSVKGLLHDFMLGEMHQSILNKSGNPVDLNDPVAFEELLTNSDPVATEGTYMVIVGALTCAVPLVTAHLCMGASNLMGFLQLSIDQTSERYYGDERNVAIRNYATGINQDIKSQNTAFVLRAKAEAEKNPEPLIIRAGQDRNGKPIFKELDRRTTGDYAMAAYVKAKSMEAAYKFRFTNSMREGHALLGSLTGRRMSFNKGKEGWAKQGIMNQINSQFFGRPMGGSNPYAVGATRPVWDPSESKAIALPSNTNTGTDGD